MNLLCDYGSSQSIPYFVSSPSLMGVIVNMSLNMSGWLGNVFLRHETLTMDRDSTVQLLNMFAGFWTE